MSATLRPRPRPPTATACPASSSRTPAAGSPGPSARTTGAWGPSPHRRRTLRSPRRSTSSEPGDGRRLRRAVRAMPLDALTVDTRRGDLDRRRLDPRHGPTFLVDDAGGRRGVDWSFNAWGGLNGGLYFPWDRDDRVAQKVLEIERRDRYRAPIVLGGRLDPRRRRGNGADDRRVPAEPEPQPRALARADRAGAVRLPRRVRR